MEVIFVGKSWKFKKALQEEILKKVTFNKTVYLDKFDINFKPDDETLIVTDENTYPLVTKILANLTNQNVIIKDDFLIPETAKFSKNSFLIEYYYPINVILLKDEVPEILIITPEYEEINIFNFDKDSAKLLLEPIFNAYKLNPVIFEEAGIVKIYTEILEEKIKKEILKTIPYTVFGNLFAHIVNNLPPKKITFAESCTGGLIASNLTKIPGSSNCFDGSVVTYANRIKHEWLGVEELTLEKYGAVSEQTVKEMLLGAIEISKADYALAVSGIAGPTGGTPTKPVGTVYIGVANNKELKVELLHLKGDRNYIQYQAMMNAIRLFITFSRLYTSL
ncbi:nicotinamide-nucleotide amidase [Lebetimonas natsushimae]|uniref:Nicotinamide-nucleotide amidase n=1 Tax=Lebetimonas natsushimae TaxID=1936991 RepID=A0A292YEX3_9BACT|nr:CinA family protein [Lebetimonas natsushimae]GAX88058.1 nicotinamide-nucleotide amidase [Lebetimonas natsushimae]